MKSLYRYMVCRVKDRDPGINRVELNEL